MSRRDYARLVAPALYVRARTLPRATLRQWLDEVERSASGAPIRTILDLGCGTGRFSFPLARRFRAAVVGVDPSSEMLAQAGRARRESVVFRRARAERIPLAAGRVDMIFMSQTWHHLHDPGRAVCEMRRVLVPSGRVCIRNSTAENISSYLYARFFPGAQCTCRRLLPARAQVIAAMRQGGFRLVRLRAVRQLFAASHRAYLLRIRQRATSDLSGLSDADFTLGIAALSRYCRSRKPDRPVHERIDLFTFARELEPKAARQRNTG